MVDRMQTEVNFNERYDRLIMPALKLISAVLCTLGRSNGVVIDKVCAVIKAGRSFFLLTRYYFVGRKLVSHAARSRAFHSQGRASADHSVIFGTIEAYHIHPISLE